MSNYFFYIQTYPFGIFTFITKYLATELLTTWAGAPEGKIVKSDVSVVTCSGSGLDPHISPTAVKYQVTRIAKANNMSEKKSELLLKNAPTVDF